MRARCILRGILRVALCFFADSFPGASIWGCLLAADTLRRLVQSEEFLFMLFLSSAFPLRTWVSGDWLSSYIFFHDIANLQYRLLGALMIARLTEGGSAGY